MVRRLSLVQVSMKLKLSFSYIYYVCSVYNYKKVLYIKKGLLIIFTTYLYVCSMLSQLKHNEFFLFFVDRNPHIFPQKSTWPNCDRYSNLTALYMTISSFKFIQYPQHMYIWYEETNTIHTIYGNQAVW